MTPLNEISFYQLENLIMQRVPFKFLNLSEEQKLLQAFSHLNSYYSRFLKDQLFTIENEEKTIEFVQTQNFSLDMPMVLLCNEGSLSKKVAFELEKIGYKNVYVIASGIQQLLLDASKN